MKDQGSREKIGDKNEKAHQSQSCEANLNMSNHTKSHGFSNPVSGMKLTLYPIHKAK